MKETPVPAEKCLECTEGSMMAYHHHTSQECPHFCHQPTQPNDPIGKSKRAIALGDVVYPRDLQPSAEKCDPNEKLIDIRMNAILENRRLTNYPPVFIPAANPVKLTPIDYFCCPDCGRAGKKSEIHKCPTPPLSESWELATKIMDCLPVNENGDINLHGMEAAKKKIAALLQTATDTAREEERRLIAKLVEDHEVPYQDRTDEQNVYNEAVEDILSAISNL